MKGVALQSSRFATLAALNTILHFAHELYDRTWDDVWYPAEWLPLAANAQAQARSVQIDTQADFAILGGVYTASDPAAEGTFFAPAPISVTVIMPGNKSLVGQVGNNQGTTHINNIFGIRGLGTEGKWPLAQLVPRGGTFTISASNLSAVQAFNLRLALFGFYIY